MNFCQPEMGRLRLRMIVSPIVTVVAWTLTNTSLSLGVRLFYLCELKNLWWSVFCVDNRFHSYSSKFGLTRRSSFSGSLNSPFFPLFDVYTLNQKPQVKNHLSYNREQAKNHQIYVGEKDE